MKNKFASALLSLVVAFGLWTYVITNVSGDETVTLTDIPVIFQNEGALTSGGRSLMLTEGTGQTVTLTVTGDRAEVLKLHPTNVSVVVDLSRIYDAGRQAVSFTVNYPADVVTSSFDYTADKNRISLTVEDLLDIALPVNVETSGTPAEGYQEFLETLSLDASKIRVIGPASVVSQMTQAVVHVDLEGLNQSIREQKYPFLLCDADGNPVEVPNVEYVKTDVDELTLDLTIQQVRFVTLDVQLNSGAGATRDTTVLDIDPQIIQVTGSDEAMEALEFQGNVISLGEIDLANYLEDQSLTLPINMLQGLTNLTGTTEATISLSFPELATKTFTITNIQTVNVPAGTIPELLTKHITVVVRGPKVLVDRMTEAAITVSVSFGNLDLDIPKAVDPTIIINPNYTGVEVLPGSGKVNIQLTEPEPEPTGDPTVDPQADPGEDE